MPVIPKVENGKVGAGRNKKGAPADPEIAPIPQGKMLNLADAVTVGRGLTLVLTCPPIGKAMQLQERLYAAWPDPIVLSVLGDLDGTGINPDAYRRVRDETRKGAVKPGEDFEPTTAAEARRAFAVMMLDFEATLTAIADTVWEVAAGSPGLTWPVEYQDVPPPDPDDADTDTDGAEDADAEPVQVVKAPPAGTQYLADALRDTCTVADLADLLRALFGCLGGFPGDIRDRFPSGEDGREGGAG